jgi:hypothetical protein
VIDSLKASIIALTFEILSAARVFLNLTFISIELSLMLSGEISDISIDPSYRKIF